jgi:hypothetical protein
MTPGRRRRAALSAGVFLWILANAINGTAANYTPDVDRFVLVVGQNVGSVTNYTASLGSLPGGIMSYTSTAGAEGLGTPASYGAGLIDAQDFVSDAAYANTVVQMGLYIDNDLDSIIGGLRDANIAAIGDWIRSAGRPVYLRIGYEFDGPWNALPPDQYVAAYQYIVNALRAQNVTNVAYVWHSCGAPTFEGYPVSAWYPGDGYVDWAGVSVYQQFDGTLGTVSDIDSFCAFAKSRNKPIMIAESTPYGGISDASWTNWFLPCIELIHRHHIQMWCYIDANWETLPMFAGQGWGNCLIEDDPLVESNWLAMVVNSSPCLNQASDLIPRLHTVATNWWCEAENGALNGVTTYADAFASGGSAVTGFVSPGDSVTITCPTAAQQFVLHYATTNNGTLGLYVNSQPRRSLPIAASGGTGGLGAYSDLLVHEAIPAGATVKLQFDAGDVSANLDYVLFRGYADSDGDGLPDDWELWRLGTIAYGPNDDPDGDGNSNYAEWVADTDPMNPASNLRISNFQVSGGTATITYAPPPNRACFIQQSTDLRNWTFLPAPVQTNIVSVSVVVSNLPPGSAFFRLYVP